jgi:hypothetical protein
MVAQTQDRRFGKGPREVGGAAVLPRGPVALAGGCLGTRAEAARRHNTLDAGAARDIGHCIEQNEGQDCAHAWDRAQTGEGGGASWGLAVCTLGSARSVKR